MRWKNISINNWRWLVLFSIWNNNIIIFFCR